MQRLLSYRHFPLDVFIERCKQIKIKLIIFGALDKYYSVILIQIYKIDFGTLNKEIDKDKEIDSVHRQILFCDINPDL